MRAKPMRSELAAESQFAPNEARSVTDGKRKDRSANEAVDHDMPHGNSRRLKPYPQRAEHSAKRASYGLAGCISYLPYNGKMTSGTTKNPGR